MPGGDRTGPVGTGPRTGRGAGYCGGADKPGFASPVGRFGLERGFRRDGRGWRHMFHDTGLLRWARDFPGSAPVAPDDEATALKNQADRLRSQLEAIQARTEQINKA